MVDPDGLACWRVPQLGRLSANVLTTAMDLSKFPPSRSKIFGWETPSLKSFKWTSSDGDIPQLVVLKDVAVEAESHGEDASSKEESSDFSERPRSSSC